MAAAESVARLVAGELGWSPEDEADAVATYRASVAAEAEALAEVAPAATRRSDPGGWVPGLAAGFGLPGRS